MLITANGEKISIQEKMSIMDFLKEKNLNPNTIVVEYNMKIIKDFENIILNENDNLEILKIVGGG